MNKKKIIGIIIAVVAVVAVIVSVLIYNHNRKIMINVVGMDYNEACKKISDKTSIDVKLVEDDSDAAYDFKKDEVYSQSVKPGEVTDTVDLYVGKGIAYKIEALYNKKYSSLSKETKDNLSKLDKMTIHYVYAPINAGRIYRPEYTETTRVFKDVPLDILICKKKIPFSETKIKGKNWNNIKKYFKGAVVSCTKKTSMKKAGTILKFVQNPASKGKKIFVDVTVSNGQGVKVPEVTGMSEKKAVKKLSKAGVNYKIKYTYKNITSNCWKPRKKVKKQNKVGLCNKTKPVVLTVNKPAIRIKTTWQEVNSVDGVETDVKFSNISNKTINYVTFTMRYFNRVGDPIEDEYDKGNEARLKYTGPLRPNGFEHTHWEAVLYDSSCACIAPYAADVVFKNGSKQRIKFMEENYYYYWPSDDFDADRVNDSEYYDQ